MGIFKKIRKAIKRGVKKLTSGVKKVWKTIKSSKALKIIAAAALAVTMPHLLVSVGTWIGGTTAAAGTGIIGTVVSGAGSALVSAGTALGAGVVASASASAGAGATATATSSGGIWNSIMGGINKLYTAGKNALGFNTAGNSVSNTIGQGINASSAGTIVGASSELAVATIGAKTTAAATAGASSIWKGIAKTAVVDAGKKLLNPGDPEQADDYLQQTEKEGPYYADVSLYSSINPNPYNTNLNVTGVRAVETDFSNGNLYNGERQANAWMNFNNYLFGEYKGTTDPLN